MWINNIFLKDDEEGKTVDCCLVRDHHNIFHLKLQSLFFQIDFQECFWGSPGIDLNHFLYTCCEADVLEDHLDSLIKFYYEKLTAVLHELEFPNIPSFEDIQEEFDAKSAQALIAVASIVPVMMIENTEYANAENFLAETEEAMAVRKEVFANSKFVEVLKFLLPKVVKRIV